MYLRYKLVSSTIHILMYFNVMYFNVLKCIICIITHYYHFTLSCLIQLCNWLFIVWVLGRFWCGKDKYYVLYNIIICYLSKTSM